MELKPFKKNAYFLTDGKTIFYQNYGARKPKPIAGVDAESFEIKSHYLACDKNRIYASSSMAEGLQIFEPADRESIVFITPSVFADKYNLYDYNIHFIEYCHLNADEKIKKTLQKQQPKADAWWNYSDNLYKNLKLLKHNIYSCQDKFFYYFRESKFLYDYPIYKTEVSAFNYDDLDSCYLELPNVDKATYEVLNSVYSKDAKQVYFYSRSIKADVATFRVINHLVAQDKNGIWYNGRLAKIQDIDSFEIITTEAENKAFHFCKDQFNVYSNTDSRIQFSGYASTLSVLKNSDPDTFQEINAVWAKDKNNVYWLGKVYKKADAATFEKISEPPLTWVDYARDKNHVYLDNGITLKKGLHGASFKILNKFWAKDDFVVYSLSSERIMKSIDVKTFKIIDENGKAEDANYFYEYVNSSLKKTAK